MIKSSSKIRVRFSETDAMGIVYHANYLPWCEVARLDLIAALGVTYQDIIAQGFHLPVLEECLRYRHPAKFGDEVEITAAIRERPEGIRIRIEYEISANKTILATGYTLHVFVDKSGRPAKPPKEFIKKLLEAFDKGE